MLLLLLLLPPPASYLDANHVGFLNGDTWMLLLGQVYVMSPLFECQRRECLPKVWISHDMPLPFGELGTLEIIFFGGHS